MRSFIYFIDVCLTCRSLSFLVTAGNLLTVSQRWDKQTVTNQCNSVCLIHVRAVRRPGCDTIKKPAVHVFLTTVIYHNIGLHWNKKRVFCKLLNVNKWVYFYPKLTCWMCVIIQNSAGAVGTGTSPWTLLKLPQPHDKTLEFTFSTVTNRCENSLC